MMNESKINTYKVIPNVLKNTSPLEDNIRRFLGWIVSKKGKV
jgi:hypothetical protein